MNGILRAAVAGRGMGFNYPDGGWKPVGNTSSSSGDDWWKQLIGQGVNIFGQWVQTRNNPQLPNVAAPTTYSEAERLAALGYAPPGSTISTGLGKGFESLAAQFGVSTTTLMLLLAGGLFLLFKPPPSRR